MITTPDLINGCFELSMGCVGLLSLEAIRKHKTVKGVHWGPTLVAAAWGYYNLFYYPFLSQHFSFFAGMGICAVNSIWLGHAWYYRRHPELAR